MDAAPALPGPDIPWLATGIPPIALTPCPEGWREVTGRDVTECDPYPEGGPEACGAGEAHFPGEPGCRSIGEACPAGDYAATLPTSGTVIYVKATAGAGGAGTLASPYAQLSEVAWDTLAAGTTVALGKGRYPGHVRLQPGVQVKGACVQETVLTGDPGTTNGVVILTSAGAPATLDNLTISGPPQHAVQAEWGSTLMVTSVLIERARRFSVVAVNADSSITLTDTVIRDTLVDPGDGLGGEGIHAQSGGRVEANRLIVDGTGSVGIFVIHAGTLVTLQDSVIRDSVSESAIAAIRGARLEAARTLVEGYAAFGVLVAHQNTVATLTDVVIRSPNEGVINGDFRGGIHASMGARIEATRIVVAHTRGAGVTAENDGTHVILADTVIRDVDAAPSDVFGSSGLTAATGARVEATRLLVTRTADTGILIGEAGTEVVLFDTAVRDTLPRTDDGTSGRGIQAQDGARIEASRIHVSGSHEVGVLAVTTAVLELSDVSVTNTDVAACASGTCAATPFGYGLVSVGAAVSMTRFEIRDSAICGFLLTPYESTMDPASVDLATGVVSGSAIGACVQVDGYDLDRLTNGVVYVDNTTNLDSTMLPVPGVSGR